VLAVAGEVTGVIDWGGTRSGDRMFDLATWLYYARENGDDLRQLIVGRIGERGLAVYLAHMAIRQADWSIRHHGEEAGWAMVRYGVQLARTFPS
jgi:aminoglycoside phosphotransferase (APT) family kinase protein